MNQVWLATMKMEVQDNSKGLGRGVVIAIAVCLSLAGSGMIFGQSGGSLFFGNKIGPNEDEAVSSGDVEIKPNDPAELKASKTKYLEKIIELKKPLTKLVGMYQAQLEKMRDEFQKAGDLDSLLATENEIDTIKKTGAPSIKVSEKSKVAGARGIYESAKIRVEADVLVTIGQFNGAYKTSLNGLKTTLMKADRLDDAITVMEFQKTIPDAPKIVSVAKPAAGRPAISTGTLRVNVQVDGMSKMLISGDEIWFDHNGGRAAAPGRHEGLFATELNDEKWMPVWQGRVTKKHNAKIGLPKSGEVKLKCRTRKGRGYAKVIEQPTKENGFVAKIGLYDEEKDGRVFSGSQFIEFDLSW